MTPEQVAEYARVMRAEGIETLELDGLRIRLASAPSAAHRTEGESHRSPADQAAAVAAEKHRLTYAHTGRGAPPVGSPDPNA